MKRAPRRCDRQRRCSSCWRLLDAVPAAVDGLGLVHAAGRGEHVSAAAAAARSRRSPTTASCSRSIGMGRYLLNSLLDRDARDAALAALQRDGRLCLREAALPRPRAHLPRAARRAGDPGAGGDDAAVPADQAARPRQHLRRRRSCRRWRACSASSWCASTRCRFPTSCSKPRASTARASCASSARSCCRC